MHSRIWLSHVSNALWNMEYSMFQTKCTPEYGYPMCQMHSGIWNIPCFKPNALQNMVIPCFKCTLEYGIFHVSNPTHGVFLLSPGFRIRHIVTFL
jgi:hypothetical protein